MKIYLMRHGTTVWNEQRRTQGQVNNRLSRAGILQSKEIANKIKDVKIDHIFCSPLLRAVQTANIINMHHKCRIIKDDRITDINQGIFTGRYFDSLTADELVLKKERAKECGMESLQELYTRVESFFKEIVEKYDSKTVLIVAHSGVISFMEKIIGKINFDLSIYDTPTNFKNCEIKCFEVIN